MRNKRRLPGPTKDQYISAVMPSGLTKAQINAFAEACITGKEQTDGQIVLQAVHKPSVELPILSHSIRKAPVAITGAFTSIR